VRIFNQFTLSSGSDLWNISLVWSYKCHGCGRQVAAIPKRIVLTCVSVSGKFSIFIAMCFVIVLVLGCGGSCILSDREHMDPVFMSIFYKVFSLRM
jgi:hypothetical protein